MARVNREIHPNLHDAAREETFPCDGLQRAHLNKFSPCTDDFSQATWQHLSTANRLGPSSSFFHCCDECVVFLVAIVILSSLLPWLIFLFSKAPFLLVS